MAYKILNILGYYRAKKAIKHKLHGRRLQKEDAHRKIEVAERILVMQGTLLNRKTDSSDVIVSLTSYGVRVSDTLPYALYSLLHQSRRPNRIVVWLDNDNWNDEKLPDLLKKLQALGVEFFYVKDLRSYKKLIPALKMFPDNVIITVDDDMYCNERLVEWLIEAYEKSDKRSVIGTWAFAEEVEDGRYLPYSKWKDKIIPGSNPRYSLIGCGGILYPPGVFDDEILKEEIFMKLAPTADDLWFWAMEKRQGIPISVIANAGYGLNVPVNRIDAWDPGRGGSLYYLNGIQGNNDWQMRELIDYYRLEASKV